MQKTVESSSCSAFVDKVVDVPVVQVVDVRVVQFLDKVVEMPVGVQRQVFVVTVQKKLRWFRSCSSSTWESGTEERRLWRLGGV